MSSPVPDPLRADDETVLPGWLIVIALLGFAALALNVFSDRFNWLNDLKDIPALWLAGSLGVCGVVFCFVLSLIRRTLLMPPRVAQQAFLLVAIAGLALRLAMLPTAPALEDDFYRYLWDGAVTANGFNPYKLAPEEAFGSPRDTPIGRLAGQGGAVLERVNHPNIKTIYPPVAQGAFALAYWIEPWSLRAWRFVCLLGELVTLGFILLLLHQLGRPLIWSALYWLNPLVIKELMNSAHMEAIVLPFVIGAIYFAVRRRHLVAVATLGLAIGAKLWPVMLAPLVLRPLLASPAKLFAALAILALMGLVWIVPPFLGGINQASGFVAYAEGWQTASALFQTLQAFLTWVLSPFAITHPVPGLIVRGGMAVLVGGTAMALAIMCARDDEQFVASCAMVVVLLFLVSPAQFPWYVAWTAIFLPFMPLAGMLALTVFLPGYYAAFHFFGLGDNETFNRWVVWGIWLPVWSAFALDAYRLWNRPLTLDLVDGPHGR